MATVTDWPQGWVLLRASQSMALTFGLLQAQCEWVASASSRESLFDANRPKSVRLREGLPKLRQVVDENSETRKG